MADEVQSDVNATEFASAERSDGKELLQSLGAIEGTKLLKETLNSLNEIIMILNRNRQIVYANRRLFAKMGLDDKMEICGLCDAAL